jgi:hypothetical protein
MAQDNREYIDRARVQQTLLKECKYSIVSVIIEGFVLVPLMALVALGFYELLPRIWPLWGLFAACTVCLFYGFFIEGLIGALFNRRLIVRGDFHVEQDYARAIDDDEPNIWDILYLLLNEYLRFLLLIPEMKSGVPYVHFSGKRRFAASKRTRDHATAGDLFYLVVLNNRKNKIAYIYNSRYYRLEEC